MGRAGDRGLESQKARQSTFLIYADGPCPSLSPGRCGGCGEDVVGDGAGVVALDRVFHVGCFVCSTCRAQLRGQHFYAVERRAYCESCYVVSRCAGGWGLGAGVSSSRRWGASI